MNEHIHPKGWTTSFTHLSWGVKADKAVYVAGMLSTDPVTGVITGHGDITAQTRQVIENIKVVLEAAGATLEDVTMNHIFIRDMTHYTEMNNVYMEYFKEPRPARFCVKLEMVKPEFLVEIATVAHIS
ncbi:Rid family hydrolase [Candidatus Burkholderia verschuerenii]|nr:Rid family hydrolase [Candidatus Burkholderia verschuerenii]